MATFRKTKCQTCPFSLNPGRLRRTPERLEEIRASQREGRPHVCHTEGLDQNYNPIAFCKGAELDRLKSQKGKETKLRDHQYAC